MQNQNKKLILVITQTYNYPKIYENEKQNDYKYYVNQVKRKCKMALLGEKKEGKMKELRNPRVFQQPNEIW